MLKRLRIKDFALIDDIDIQFFGGLNVLTGETGAGKSIILESLSLLFGKRSDAEMIRYQANTALVIGEFVLNAELQEKYSTDVFTIKREIDLSGRHTIRLNDEIITLAKLREIARSIGMIHSQTETLSLLDKESYLNFIDMVDEVNTKRLFNDYQIKRSEYLELAAKYHELQNKRTVNLERKDFLAFQINELEALSLKENEKEDLLELVNKLANFERIKTALSESYQLLNDDESRLDNIYDAKKALDKISKFDAKYAAVTERLNAVWHEITDISSFFYTELHELDFDDETFNAYQERIVKLESVEKKYQKTIKELIKYLKAIKDEYLMITDYDSFLANAKQALDNAYEKSYHFATLLSEKRKASALVLESKVLEGLAALNLAKTTFRIVFTATKNLLESGIDDVDFYISLNEGEIERPLAKVASGGERSRFLFVIKSIYALENKLSMLVLDEIDIGISGKTASLVAKKMAQLADGMQLLVITHLPQVAARADHHFGITKVKTAGRMTSVINELNFDERVEALAMMLSDEKLTSHAIMQAKSMLKK